MGLFKSAPGERARSNYVAGGATCPHHSFPIAPLTPHEVGERDNEVSLFRGEEKTQAYDNRIYHSLPTRTASCASRGESPDKARVSRAIRS